MSVETFELRRLQRGTLAIIEQAITIIGEYRAIGLILTIRQLFYQFVSRALLENVPTAYKRLGSIIKTARRSGLIDWDAIEDRTRTLRGAGAWPSPAAALSALADQYRENRWQGQQFRPELWIEKDALLGVIEGVSDDLRVPYFACRGNNSESEQYRAGKRFERYAREGLTPIVLHLGDHDPNGLDMTRDNRDRLALFARSPVEVRRLALNFDQVERYRPPPNFAKESDTRFAAYAQKYGRECWELDALDPTVIVDLIRAEIEGLIDPVAWRAAETFEAANRDRLAAASENWAKVESFLGGASS